MPRIKRWYHVSHRFNHDPEVRALRRDYADWMGYVWLEMLSWADLNNGEIKGKQAAIAESLSDVSLTKRPSLASKHIINAMGFMEKCGWIRIETDRILIAKYADYNPSRDAKQIPQGNQLGSPPILPILPSEPKEEDVSCANPKDSAPASSNGRIPATGNDPGY